MFRPGLGRSPCAGRRGVAVQLASGRMTSWGEPLAGRRTLARARRASRQIHSASTGGSAPRSLWPPALRTGVELAGDIAHATATEQPPCRQALDQRRESRQRLLGRRGTLRKSPGSGTARCTPDPEERRMLDGEAAEDETPAIYEIRAGSAVTGSASMRSRSRSNALVPSATTRPSFEIEHAVDRARSGAACFGDPPDGESLDALPFDDPLGRLEQRRRDRLSVLLPGVPCSKHNATRRFVIVL